MTPHAKKINLIRKKETMPKDNYQNEQMGFS